MTDKTQQTPQAPELEAGAIPFSVVFEPKGESSRVDLVIRPSKKTGKRPPMQKLLDLVMVRLGLEQKSLLNHKVEESPEEYRAQPWRWKKEGSREILPDDRTDPAEHIHPGDQLVVQTPPQVAGRRGKDGGR